METRWPLALLALLVGVWGLLLRSGRLPPRSSFGLPLPWTYADPDVWRGTNRRFGLLLLLWAGWMVVQVALGPASVLGGLLAPAFLVTVLSLSHSARLYVRKYGTLRVTRVRENRDKPYPATGGWAVVVFRELLPLVAVLVPILIIRTLYPDLPDRIPARWDMLSGATDWRLRDEGLALLRQQTRFVYLLLLLGEGGYLLWGWFREQRRNIAARMLTRRHWLFFLFKLGWVAVFSGINLGLVMLAREETSMLPYLAPGLSVLALAALGTVLEHRRTEYIPPAGSRVRGTTS